MAAPGGGKGARSRREAKGGSVRRPTRVSLAKPEVGVVATRPTPWCSVRAGPGGAAIELHPRKKYNLFTFKYVDWNAEMRLLSQW